MSEFWSKFKNVFIQEDSNDNSQQQPVVKPNLREMASPTPTSAPSVTTTPQTPSFKVTVGDGKVNEKFMQALFASMEAANLDGFDYFEYKLSIQNLANMPLDEATRYKSAYAMGTTMGVTLDKLVNSAQHYLDVLKNEYSKFSQTAENQRIAQVGNKQTQVDNLEAVMKQKAEQIKQLTAEIEQNRQEVTKMKDDIAQSTVKVEQTKNDFNATYQSLVGQIEQDVTNMKNYLK